MQTLRQMRQYVMNGRVAPAIRDCALRMIYNTPERNQAAECGALFNYVRDNIRYTRDVLGVETVATAENTLQSQMGDCDDQTTLLCALFESAGYPTRFVVAGYSNESTFEHVYCQVLCNGQWTDADPTEKHALGWAPPDPACIAFEQV
jgi:transglutaminase-like putative cysteine protease